MPLIACKAGSCPVVDPAVLGQGHVGPRQRCTKMAFWSSGYSSCLASAWVVTNSAWHPPYSQANGRRSQGGAKGEGPVVASQRHEQPVGYLRIPTNRASELWKNFTLDLSLLTVV